MCLSSGGKDPERMVTRANYGLFPSCSDSVRAVHEIHGKIPEVRVR